MYTIHTDHRPAHTHKRCMISLSLSLHLVSLSLSGMNWFGDEEITHIHTCICSRALSLSRKFWIGAEHTHGTHLHPHPHPHTLSTSHSHSSPATRGLIKLFCFEELHTATHNTHTHTYSRHNTLLSHTYRYTRSLSLGLN